MATKRREFIRSACGLCLLGTAGMLTSSLAGCGTAYPVFKTEAVGNKLTVPLSLFAQAPLQIVRSKGAYNDIAVQKKDDNTYTALLLVCTHQQNALTITGNGYTCTLHGSEFDKTGAVRKGPAERALKQYQTTVSGNDLIIQL